MVQICRTQCPFLDKCHRLALDQGKAVVGVWGGSYWQYGKELDPFGTDYGDMRSVYHRVHYDRTRGKWKAEVQVDYGRIYLGYHDDELEAARAVRRWEEENEDWRR